MNYLLIGLVILVLYFFYSNSSKESFENSLPSKIVDFFKQYPNANYPSYAQMLMDNENTYVKLSELSVYEDFKSKANVLTEEDIIKLI